MDPTPRPVVSTPPVLLTRTYRLAKRWNEGPARHAAKLLLLLPPAAVLGLVLHIFLVNSLCFDLAGSDACVTGFHLVNRAALILFLAFAFLCLSSLLARLFLRLRRAKASRQAQAALVSLRARLGGADPLQAPLYARLHEQWRQDHAPDRVHRHVALFLILPVLAAGATAFASFLAAQAYFHEYGSLLVFEFDIGPINYAILEVLVVASLYLLQRLVRTAVASRRLAALAREDFDRGISSSEAALLRSHRHPDAPPEQVPAITFRPWSARARDGEPAPKP